MNWESRISDLELRIKDDEHGRPKGRCLYISMCISRSALVYSSEKSQGSSYLAAPTRPNFTLDQTSKPQPGWHHGGWNFPSTKALTTLSYPMHFATESRIPVGRLAEPRETTGLRRFGFGILLQFYAAMISILISMFTDASISWLQLSGLMDSDLDSKRSVWGPCWMKSSARVRTIETQNQDMRMV